MAADPVFPAAVADTVAEPAANAVTKPSGATFTIAGALLTQVRFWPAKMLPFTSLTDPASETVAPATMLTLFCVTATEPTCAAVVGVLLTVTATAPLLPPLVAEIIADPGEIPVTRPFAFTLTMSGALLDQIMDR